MINPFKFQSLSILSIAALSLIGCKRQQIVYYEIAKEDNNIEQMAEDISRNTDLNMEGRRLPPENMGSAANPSWTIPEGWLPGKASTMRRGSFAVVGPDNQGVDISVTTFPGDVGGELLNINRWRRQVGLSPISIDSLDEHIVTKTISEMTYRIVDFSTEKPKLNDNYPQRTIVATIIHEGNSWFFKMTGDAPLVALQEEVFMGFLSSVYF